MLIFDEYTVVFNILFQNLLPQIKNLAKLRELRLFNHPKIIQILKFFPPNTFIPSPMLINFKANVHPILLFHTLRLLGSQEYLNCSRSWTKAQSLALF